MDALAVGLVIALLLGAAGESHRRTASRKKEEEVDLVTEAKADKGTIVVFGIFFWLFIIVLAAFVIFGIVRFSMSI